MSNRRIAGALAVIGSLALGACSGYGTGPKEYSLTNDTGLGATGGSPSGSVSGGTSDKPARGGTISGAGGSTAASSSAPAGPSEKQDQRGNTPPGKSRDGAGPMEGAIVDPTGSVTKGK